jgi:hypothetical protein
MKKIVTAIAVILMSGPVLAEINCFAVRGEEALKVKIIDTFLDRMAFIERSHPTIDFPKEEINVEVMDEKTHLSVVSRSLDFNLVINKHSSERRLPPIYQGALSYKEIFTQIDCVLE